MTTRIFTPENRLAKVLETLTGPTADELALDADQRVAKLGDAIRAYIYERMEVIRPFATMDEGTFFAECRTLGSAALNIAEVAGACGWSALGDVARGIAAMVDALVSKGAWHTDALRLHLDALSMVAQAGGDHTEANDVILEKLRVMRAAIGIPE